MIVDAVAVLGQVGYGLKVRETEDNRHDLALDLSLKLTPHALFYVQPGVHWAWSNLSNRDFAGQQLAWASTNVGSSF